MPPSPIHKTNYAAEALTLLTSRYQKDRPPLFLTPTVATIAPPLGDASGGVPVTITGTNFTGTTGITINGVACTSVVIVNATTITAVTPAVASSLTARDVAVTNPAGTGTLAAAYTSFWPTLVTGSKLWLRADLGVTIGTGVSTWADQSGNANDATQATGTKQPTVNASDALYNNQKTLSLSAAASQFLATGAGLALAEPYTVVFVGNDDGSGFPQIFTSDKAASIYNCGNNGSGVYYASGGANVFSTQAVSNAPRVYIATIDGASTKLRFSAATPNVVGNIGGGTLTGLSIGCVGNGTTFFLNGKCAEVVVYNSALGATDIAKLNAYLGMRYGITIGP